MTASNDEGYGAKLAADLRLLADMAENEPLIADELRYSALRGLNVPLTSNEDPRGAMATFIRAALASGASVEKSYDGDYGGADIAFPSGALTIHVYADREKVCTKRVIGTREVTEEVPDPDALAQVPTVTVIRTVEDVEWDCLPLLAEAAS